MFDKDSGIGHVVVGQQKVSGVGGVMTVGVFLLDVFCLGVKDAFRTQILLTQWEDLLERVFRDRKHEPLEPACAKKLVLDAIAYARGLGLEPHADYVKASHVLTQIDASACSTTFTFGSEGKPLYIQGPYDSPVFVKRVMESLKKHAPDTGGGEKFHFIVRAEAVNPEDLSPPEEEPANGE